VNPTEIEFDVPGLPAPQGSKSAFVVNGRAVLVDGTSKPGRAALKAWREAVETAAIAAMLATGCPTMTGPVEVAIKFRFPRPASAALRVRHATKPDGDKLVRATFDALVTAKLLADDSLVWHHSASKFYSDDRLGATVVVHDSSEDERADQIERRAVIQRRRLSIVR
jgi:Holliday junction resolvase RusA-like endonuclease